MQRNDENTSLDSWNIDQQPPSGKNHTRRNPAQSRQYRETQLSTGNTEYERRNPAQSRQYRKIERNPAQYQRYRRNPAQSRQYRETQPSPGNTEYEIVAGGIFIWRDVEVRKKRREKKPRVQLKAVKCGQGGIINQGTNQQHAIISTKKHSIEPGIKHSICQPPRAGTTKLRIATETLQSAKTSPTICTIRKNTTTPPTTSIANLHLNR